VTALLALLFLGPSTPQTCSYYSDHGQTCADGSVFDAHGYTCASRTLPFGAVMLVAHGRRAVLVRCTDRGPWATDSTGAAVWPLRAHETREIDLSLEAAKRLGIVPIGVAECHVWRVQ